MKTQEKPNLEVPNDLKESARKRVADSVNVLAADALALYLKTKNFHWHVTGPHFRDYHLLFDEQADQIFATFDVLAERARKLGFQTLTSVGDVSRRTKIKDDDELGLTPDEMAKRLIHDNLNSITAMRKSHELCDESGDVATASILEVFIDEAERRLWFLQQLI